MRMNTWSTTLTGGRTATGAAVDVVAFGAASPVRTDGTR